MHKKILKDATDEQVREFVTDFITMLKARDEDLYHEAELWLYKEVYGCHFNEWKLNIAVSKLKNEDGTIGGHWTLEQTNNVARQYGMNFSGFNEYDWNYAMNVIYSDYYGVVNNNLENYFRLAQKFIMDKDAPEGKVLKYYIAMEEE